MLPRRNKFMNIRIFITNYSTDLPSATKQFIPQINLYSVYISNIGRGTNNNNFNLINTIGFKSA